MELGIGVASAPCPAREYTTHDRQDFPYPLRVRMRVNEETVSTGTGAPRNFLFN